MTDFDAAKWSQTDFFSTQWDLMVGDFECMITRDVQAEYKWSVFRWHPDGSITVDASGGQCDTWDEAREHCELAIQAMKES